MIIVGLRESKAGSVTANSAIIVFLVYLYSYDEFCSILFSYLIILGAPLFGPCSGR